MMKDGEMDGVLRDGPGGYIFRVEIKSKQHQQYYSRFAVDARYARTV